MRRRWYVDLWPRTGRRAFWCHDFEHFAPVRMLIEALRGPEVIIRIIPPIDASRTDLDALERIGVRQIG
jgi:hypothetical protein